MTDTDDNSPWFDLNHPMNQVPPRRKPTVEELEKLLNSEEDAAIEILPNGEIRAIGAGEREGVVKPLTYRENLGGEYAEAA